MELTELEKLSDIARRRRQKIREYRNVHAQWSTWNHWASQHPYEYNKWAVENCFGPNDLKSKSDRGVPIIKDWGEGAPLWHLRHLLFHEKEMLAQEESDWLRYLYNKTDDKGFFQYSLDEIANAYGHTPGYTHRHLYTLGWFKSRNSMDGKKKYRRLRSV